MVHFSQTKFPVYFAYITTEKPRASAENIAGLIKLRNRSRSGALGAQNLLDGPNFSGRHILPYKKEKPI